MLAVEVVLLLPLFEGSREAELFAKVGTILFDFFHVRNNFRIPVIFLYISNMKMKKLFALLLCISFIISCKSKSGCQDGPRIKTQMGTIKKH